VTRRAGFTLVELLIVLAIIALLVSLTAAAVLRFINVGPDVQTRNEIGNMETALTAAKNDLSPGTQLEYLPSILVLREDCQYGTTPLELASIAFLKKAFGKRINLTPRTALDIAAGNYIDWNGNGVCDQPLPTNAPFILDGGQCLVFWLGGIPSSTGCTGFSTNPLNPADSTTPHKPPYYEFRAARLVAGLGGFFYYVDAYKTSSPFAYFTAYPNNAGYNIYNVSPYSDCFLNGSSPLGTVLTGYSTSFTNLQPYLLSATATSTATKWVNPSGFQIISAGRDGAFGNITAGGVWNPSQGWPANDPGADDIANFSRAVLGAPQS
jgi:prepilin-type N-terminal cleavage/methylation domain-containing protein